MNTLDRLKTTSKMSPRWSFIYTIPFEFSIYIYAVDFVLINSTAAASAQTQKKTLEQREAEYAEARMRIFGAASSSPEEQNGSVPER